MGLGLHGGGLAVAKFLARRGALVTVTDLKNSKELAPALKKLQGLKIRYVLGRHELKDFIQADLVIKNPGVHGQNKFLEAAQKHHVPIETDLSLFFQLCPSNFIIGITGTKGKSTTTSLVYQIIKAFRQSAILGGNIRISPLDYLDKIKKNTPVVLELSSWQLEGLGESKVSPRFALVTNVLADHLNTYAGMGAYSRAKSLIFKFQKPGDFTVLNADNDLTRAMAKQVKAKLFWYSLKKLKPGQNGAYLQNGWLIFKQGRKAEKVLAAKEIKIKGRHNISNVLAAITLSKIFGAPAKLIRSEIKKFKGIEGRLELVKEVNGIKYFNDTTATTPDAVIAALNTFDQKVVLLAGGTDKELDFKDLAPVIKTKTKALILFEGTATDKLLKSLAQAGYTDKILTVKSMPQAFALAQKILKRKDIFLLSPAAASFGLFKNEFDRGGQFNQQVNKIK